MWYNRRKQEFSYSRYLLFALSPDHSCQTSPEKPNMSMADNDCAPAPETRATASAVCDPKAAASLSSPAPPASPVVPTDTAVSNACTPATCEALCSAPPTRTSPLRKRRGKPPMTDQAKDLAGLSSHMSMEERIDFCLAVAKNLLDSPPCSRGPRPLVQSANTSSPVLPLQERGPANASCTHASNERLCCPAARSDERPEQKRKPLFRLKLPVGPDLSQLAVPATIDTPTALREREAASNLVAVSPQQQQTHSPKSQTAQEDHTAHEKCHL